MNYSGVVLRHYKWAADDLRSVSAQIEFLLRQSVSRRKGPGK
jgi:hypothetical protein